MTSLRRKIISPKGSSRRPIDEAAAKYAASTLATTLKVKYLNIVYHVLGKLAAQDITQPEKVLSEQNLA